MPDPERAAAPAAATEDAILGGRLRLLQPAAGYRVGIDPVLLAAAAAGLLGEGPARALDLGCGVGAAALCLAHGAARVEVAGLELQAPLAELARRNVELNGLAGRVAIHQGDLLRPPAALAGAGFDLVLANPPFHIAGRATAPKEPGRARGHMEGEAGLAAWLDQALKLAAPGGRLAIIHRPERLGEILRLLDGRAGAVALFPLWPSAGRPARRVIVSARKGSAAPLVLAQGLVLHDPDGRYTPAAEAVLRGGEPIAL